jgi:spore coat polysaccharide biosynthesis protein SpsF
MQIVAIIQARMGSTRLPGKVLMDLAGKTMLERVMQRCRRTVRLDEVIIATTDKTSDDPIAELCAQQDWPCFRGSEDDVLDRYYQAARWRKADTVVRITSDCPLIDSEVIDRCIKEFLETPNVGYVTNCWPFRTFPRGLDVEVFSFAVLEQAWRQDYNPAWREHVTPYIYCHPEIFQVRAIVNDVDYSNMRWCVDTQEDLALVRNIYEAFGTDRFSWRQVLTILQQNPQWLELNCTIIQKEL